MVDNEVKIHVSADADTQGIDDTAARLRKLKEEQERGAKTPAQPAATPSPAAKPSQPAQKGKSQLATEANPQAEQEKPRRRWQDLRPLTDAEREQNRLRNEQADKEQEQGKHTKERVAAERATTRELREQTAMRKAGLTRAASAVSAGQAIAGSANASESLSSMLASAGMASGNPLLMIGGLLAATGVGVAGVVSQERDRDTAANIQHERRQAGQKYRQERAGGIFGSSGDLVSNALDADEEINSRKAARKDIEEKKRQKWYAPSTWEWFGLRKNEGHREEEENEKGIADAEKRKKESTEKAQKKYMAEEGGLELRALRGRASRSMAGSRDAFVAEMGQEWMAKYKEALKSSGSEKVAKEMADLTVENKVRDRQAAAGAGMVGAMSGGAEIAAAARWGQQAFPSDLSGEIKSLHATVQAQANPLKDQSKK